MLFKKFLQVQGFWHMKVYHAEVLPDCTLALLWFHSFFFFFAIHLWVHLIAQKNFWWWWLFTLLWADHFYFVLCPPTFVMLMQTPNKMSHM